MKSPAAPAGWTPADVGNVTVACGFGQWTWDGGPNTANASGVYGTQGSAAAGNLPGARYDASSWTDSSGNFWLFGGVGYDSSGVTGYLNDLWRYSPSTGLWTWVSGGNLANASGVYGTLGTAAAGNVPGARQAASSWIDSSGNLWLFGGVGYDSSGAVGRPERSVAIQSEHAGSGPGSVAATLANASGLYGTLGHRRRRQCAGSALFRQLMDRRFRQPVAVRRGRPRLNRCGRKPERSVAIQPRAPASGPGSVAAWVTMPAGSTARRHRRGQQRAGSALFGQLVDRRLRQSVAVRRLWLRLDRRNGGLGKLNDLWQYSPSSGQWTWVNGEDQANANAVSTARWESLQPLTCRERAREPLPGSTLPATCGCSAGSAMTPPVLWET